MRWGRGWLFYNFIEITFQHGFSPINLLRIFRTPFLQEQLWMAASAILSCAPECDYKFHVLAVHLHSILIAPFQSEDEY